MHNNQKVLMMRLFEKYDPGTKRDTQKKCMLCSKQFKIGRKEHQCKRCFRAVCSDCGKEKSMVFMQGFAQQPHRNCKICVEESKGVKQYINSNKIVFGSLSIVGQKWVKKIQKTYSLSRSQPKKSKNFNRELFNRMWDSYNFSMREFIGFLTFNSSQQDIYGLVYAVSTNLQNAFPKQNIQCLAYLSIFLLCFCTPDKATALGIQLLEFKHTVTDSQGLLSAYLKALGMGQQDKIRSYVKSNGNKFVSSLSINVANVNSSIYLIQKVINRKKIDQIYMFFTLSLDVIKDSFLQQRYQSKYYSLLLVRDCNPNSTSSKYRQASSVKSSFFIKELEAQNIMNFTSKEDKSSRIIQKQHNLSYNGGSEVQKQEPKLKKKYTQFSGFQKNEFTLKVQQNNRQASDDSLSMISMIQQLKQLQRPAAQVSDGNQILALLNGANFKRNEQSQPKFSGLGEFSGVLSPIRLSPNQNQLLSLNSCVSCQDHKSQIESLKRQLQQYNKSTETIDYYKQQNQQLKEKLKKYERQTSNNLYSARQNLLVMQKTDLQTQLKKLKQNFAEFQNKQVEYQLSAMKQQQAKKVIKRLETEVRTLQSQNQESKSTIKMLTNRLQSYALESTEIQKQANSKQTFSAQNSTSQAKITDLLKQSLKQKNIQIEQLAKKNKLLAYQIQQASRSGRDSKQLANFKQKLHKLQSQRESYMRSIKDLSAQLLEEQSQKLRLSEDNFSLKQILRENRISFF